MKKMKLTKSANCQFNETSEGNFVAFATNQEVDQNVEILPNKIVLIDVNGELIFNIGIDEAKNLLKQLKLSITMCDYFNLIEKKIPI